MNRVARGTSTSGRGAALLHAARAMERMQVENTALMAMGIWWGGMRFLAPCFDSDSATDWKTYKFSLLRFRFTACDGTRLLN